MLLCLGQLMHILDQRFEEQKSCSNKYFYIMFHHFHNFSQFHQFYFSHHFRLTYYFTRFFIFTSFNTICMICFHLYLSFHSENPCAFQFMAVRLAKLARWLASRLPHLKTLLCLHTANTLMRNLCIFSQKEFADRKRAR